MIAIVTFPRITERYVSTYSDLTQDVVATGAPDLDKIVASASPSRTNWISSFETHHELIKEVEVGGEKIDIDPPEFIARLWDTRRNIVDDHIPNFEPDILVQGDVYDDSFDCRYYVRDGYLNSHFGKAVADALLLTKLRGAT